MPDRSPNENHGLHPDTLCVHAGVEPEPVTGAIMTPIFQTSTYVQEAPAKHKGYDYSRAGNPTRTVLETSLAALEGAKHCMTFASGLAAEQAILQMQRPGDHVLVSEDAYGGTGRLFRHLFAPMGIRFSFIDLRDLDAIAAATAAGVALIWIESPTNPLLRVLDIAAICEIAGRDGAQVVVDNTFCSPLVQQPFRFGADFVVHSTTKYIGGHSDLIGGAVMTNDDEAAERLRFIQMAAGAVNAPFECFLLLRSIKTLALRMERHSANGLRVARELEAMPAFSRVLYPGLPDHPEHELARRQMNGFTGIVSAYLNGNRSQIERFVSELKIFALAESLGGVESLVNHPETMTHASVPPELRRKLRISHDLLRFSVGIEDPDDLVADIRQALAASGLEAAARAR